MTDTPTIRLAILLCDTPLPPILEKDGNYQKIFDTWLRITAPVDFTLDAFDVVHKMEYPPEGIKYDAIIFTGSAASAHEDVEWIDKLVNYTSNLPGSRPDAKIFAICFGHQIIGRAFGGTCVRNSEWDVGIAEVHLTEIGQRIFGTKGFNIQRMNKDHVPAVPPGFELLGSGDICHNQGMVKYVPDETGKLAKPSDIQILTVQGHPEFTKSIVATLVGIRAERGILTPECAEDAIERNKLVNEAPKAVGSVIWDILGVTRAKNYDTSYAT